MRYHFCSLSAVPPSSSCRAFQLSLCRLLVISPLPPPGTVRPWLRAPYRYYLDRLRVASDYIVDYETKEQRFCLDLGAEVAHVDPPLFNTSA